MGTVRVRDGCGGTASTGPRRMNVSTGPSTFTRHRRRSAVVGVAAVLGLGLVPVGATQAADDFGAGTGRASAKLLRVGPSRGALTLAPQVGLALSDFLNTRGRGDVRAVDYAALESSLPPEMIENTPAVKVESTDDNSEAGRTENIVVPTEVPVTVAAGRLHAEAGAAPYGASSFRAGAIDFGIGSVSGGVAESRSAVVNGNTREATATVRFPRLEIAGGAAVLTGLEWKVVARSGAATTEQAQFRLGQAVVAGETLALPSGGEAVGATLAAALAPVLDPLGIHIDFPEARIEGGVVELTPLRLRLAGSQVGVALNPILEAVQPGREALIDGIRSGTEEADAAILVGDVALGVLAGGSALDIELGGVTAFTAEPADLFEFGSFDLSPSPPVTFGDLARPDFATSSGAFDLSADGSGSDQLTIGGTGGSGDELAQPVARTELSGRAGALLAVALIVLAVAVAVAVADYQRLRRGPRLIPT